MNKSLMVGLALVFLAYVPCLGNPLPPYEIGSVKANPPQVGILNAYADLDASGLTIITKSGIATIDSGVTIPVNWWSNQPFILDSSNTTGLVINPEGDSIVINLSPYYQCKLAFGQLGMAPAPIDGYAVKYYSMPMDPYSWLFSFEFAWPLYGQTKVVINEVSSSGTWDRCGNFVELYNRAAYTVSLNHWRLICDTIYDFPADAVIPAHGYYVVDECNFPAKFHMYPGGDNLYLVKNDTLVDQVGWSTNHGANVSFMRYPDGDVDTSNWAAVDFMGYDDISSTSFENGFPSRGASNRNNNPGFIAIGARADSINFNTAQIHWTNPIWDSDFLMAIVVRSELGYVSNPADGQIIYEGLNQTYMDGNLFSGLTYYYTIFARKHDNTYSTPTSESQTSIILHSSSITEKPLLPADFQMSCYPNPFNAQTMISFALPAAVKAKIAIYDITGRIVDIVADRQFQAGQNSVIWNATNKPSGVYFYSIKTNTHSQAKTVVLMK
jgi:hypothetical protein